MKHTALGVLVLLPTLAVFSSCRPTYTSGNVVQAITQICEKEYGVQVSIQTADKTIGALIPASDILKSDLTLSDQVFEKIDHVMLTVTRVALSSEAKYEFFVIVIRDFRTGLQISFVRYLKDIRRVVIDDISRTDFFQRMLIDVEPIDPSVPFRVKSYQLPQFLARQISERLRQDMELNIVAARLFQLESIDGVFMQEPAGSAMGIFSPQNPSGNRIFRMTLVFHPLAQAFETVGTPTLREDFLRLFLHMAQNITRRYDFYAFDGLEIVDWSGRRLAFFDSKQFSKNTLNTLMDLFRSIKEKGK